MKELWKDVAGYEGIYKVSNKGRVKSLPRRRYCGRGRTAQIKGCFIYGATRDDGYVIITLNNVGKCAKAYLHRLVAEAFIPNPENKRTVNHIDGNPSNNIVSNLEWTTYSENHKHAYSSLGRKHVGNLGNTGDLSKKSIPVVQILDGKEIATFPGMRAAERETGIRNSGISAACSGKALTAGGYQWMIKKGETHHEYGNSKRK